MRSRRPPFAPRRGVPLGLVELEARLVPTFYGNQLFPLDNPWNQDISAAPVAANSSAIIDTIVSRHGGTAPRLHPDFGNPVTDGALYGIPVNVVDSSVSKVTVVIPQFGYQDESDLVQVPIPAGAVIEGDGPTGPVDSSQRGDSHLIVYDKTANVVYELYQAVRPTETVFPYGGNHPTGQWGAYQISMWDLNANSFRTIGATSADAAGLPILPGLVRPDEALPASQGGQGAIHHAIRMTVQQTLDTFVYPASHEASSLTASDLPRMGERFRLKSSFVIPATWSPEARAIAQAMKTYGMIVADNGSDMFFQGTPSDEWDMDAVLRLNQIRATDFEVVDLRPIVRGLNITSGPAAGGTSVTILGQNFSGAAGQLHVLFGGVEASSVTVVSDTRLVAVAPAHAAGTVDVLVQSGTTRTDTDGQPVFFGYGTSTATAADRFTFGGPPPPPAPPIPPPTPAQPFAVGTDPGQVAKVTLYNADGTVRFTATPFGNYTGGVRVAVGDVTGDGVADVLVGTNGAGAARARVIDGATGSVFSTQLLGTTAYTGSVSVAVGDVTGDGVPDMAVGTNQNGPRVQIFRGGDFARLVDFRPGSATYFKNRTQVALADLNADGRADLVVTAMYSNGTRVFGYTGTSLQPGVTPVAAFHRLTLTGNAWANSLFLAAGDVTGDGFADLILGSGAGNAPRVIVYSGQPLVTNNTGVAVADFAPAGANKTTGVRVTARDINGDGKLDILTASGERVTALKGGSLPATGLPPQLFAFDPDPLLAGAVWVG